MTWATLAVPFALLAVWAYCLVDFVRTDPADVRTFTREAWILLLVLANVFGGILWLMLGRPENR